MVAMATDGEEAVSKAERLRPDVAVLDVRMPKFGGLAASRRIRSTRPGTGIVMMSNYDDPEYIIELLRDGTEGKAYLLKTSVEDIYQLVGAVEAVAGGRTYLDAALVERLVNAHISSPSLLASSLRHGERDTLSLMASA